MGMKMGQAPNVLFGASPKSMRGGGGCVVVYDCARQRTGKKRCQEPFPAARKGVREEEKVSGTVFTPGTVAAGNLEKRFLTPFPDPELFPNGRRSLDLPIDE
jgi:hypothetical protein